MLVYPLFSDEGGNDSERTYVKQVVQKYLTNDSGSRVHEASVKGLKDTLKDLGE